MNFISVGPLTEEQFYELTSFLEDKSFVKNEPIVKGPSRYLFIGNVSFIPQHKPTAKVYRPKTVLSEKIEVKRNNDFMKFPIFND
jgi:hypothetical protein